MPHPVKLRPVSTNVVLKDKVYEALKEAITLMDVYSDESSLRLEERRLAEELGVSRTPVREAITRLEQDGLVEIIPRRGAFVVRKTKEQILEIICVWAALESMAARIATKRASDEQIAQLRKMFVTFNDGADAMKANIDEYSETNIHFHHSVMGLAGCDLLSQTAEGLFMHMRSIRSKAMRKKERAERSIVDHMSIIEALETRDADLAEKLIREHTLKLAEEIEMNVINRAV
jgi:DNA-binding GntR family transcriptional regulator